MPANVGTMCGMDAAHHSHLLWRKHVSLPHTHRRGLISSKPNCIGLRGLVTQLSGLVVKAQSGFFTVETERGEIVCKIPKRMRYKRRKQQKTQDERESTIVTVGDRVVLSINEDGDSTIESVEPRHHVLSRARPAANGRQVLQDREQVLVANPDQVIFVFSARDPEPSLRKLDRLLVIAEMNDLPAIICINKIDLVEREVMQTMLAPYEQIGYRVIFTSAVTNEGIETLVELLHNKISVFSGSSGVGKSSLLNVVQSGLGAAVGAVSEATTKGMHTTRHTTLFKLDGGGYLADTPGIRGVALFDVEPEELDAYFREIAPLVESCRFGDCTHRTEPGCAVQVAVENGEVSAERYDSYLRLREEHEALQRKAYY